MLYIFLNDLVYVLQLLAQPSERGNAASSELLQLPVILNGSVGNSATEAVTRPHYVTTL